MTLTWADDEERKGRHGPRRTARAIQLNRARDQIVPRSHVGVQADVIQVDGHWLIKDAKTIPQPQL